MKNTKAVLLVNLGSPDSPEVKDVKRYLAEFLMDEKVIDVFYLWRFLLVRGIIVNTRAKKSAEAYASIWTKEGSPLIVNSEKLQQACEQNSDLPIFLAMRYGNPSLSDTIKEIVNKGFNEVLAIPLYPQYAMSTTESTIVAIQNINKKYPNLKIDFIESFFKDETYLDTITNTIVEELKTNSYEHILFSYHGIPERHIFKTDQYSHCKINKSCCETPSVAHKYCYRHQSFAITDAVMQRISTKVDFSSSFQSRLGKDEWLKPYTANYIAELAQSGVKRLLVVCPSFVADCLETLEEIAIEAKDIFIENGGEYFEMLPCLNEALEPVITNQIAEWK